MSGFPLDPLCTPIRIVTQLLWMGLRERQSRREGRKQGEREREKERACKTGDATFKDLDRKQECEPGQ